MTDDVDRRILEAAERLFYAHGIGPVTVQNIRHEAGVSLKLLYSRYPAKSDLAEAYLRSRNDRWLADLAGHVERAGEGPRTQVAAVFDWLHAWFASPDFNGCAFVNAGVEARSLTRGAGEVVDAHFVALRKLLRGLVRDLPDGRRVADELLVLVEGATVLARVHQIEVRGYGNLDADLASPWTDFAAWFVDAGRDDLATSFALAEKTAPELAGLLEQAAGVLAAPNVSP